MVSPAPGYKRLRQGNRKTVVRDPVGRHEEAAEVREDNNDDDVDRPSARGRAMRSNAARDDAG